MDDAIRDLADHPIRRAVGFALMAVLLVLVALSFDLVLACRTSAVLLAGLWVALWVAAQRAPSRDVRHTEFFLLLRDSGSESAVRLLSLPPERRQDMLGGLLRERLLWHADRVALAALAVGAAGFLLFGLRALRTAG